MSDDYGYDYHSKENQLRRAQDKERAYRDGETQQGNGGGCVVLIAAVGVASTFFSYGVYYLLS